MDPTVSHEQLLGLLRHTLGTKVELITYAIGNQRHDYLVLLARLAHPTLTIVVKLAGPEAPLASQFDRTALLHRLVAAETTIPMPQVLAVNMSYQSWPWRYLIRTHIPGHEWVAVRSRLSPDELPAAYRQLGDAVGQLHRIRFPTFGEIPVAGPGPEQPYLAALAEHARSVIRDPRLRDLFFAGLESRRHLFQDVGRPALCHEDLHHHNILFRIRGGRWELATILDFDKAWAGHPETDLARLDLWRGMTSDAFWAAYRAIAPVDPLYRERRPLYQLLWCLEFAQPTAEHLADTRRVCAELGLPAPDRFD